MRDRPFIIANRAPIRWKKMDERFSFKYERTVPFTETIPDK